MTAGIHFDSVGGASGDMILAALLDLGVESAWLEEQLAGLGVGPFRIRADESADRGIRGRRLALTLPDSPASSSSHIHPHPHGIGARLHGLLHRVGGRPQDHSHAHGAHRGLREIEAILNAATLPEPVRESSRTVFRRLAEVEAHIHGTTPDQVHFHEIGALDALADIVGANLARQALGVGWVSVAPLPIGRGTVACAHGILPLPAPATAALLTGFPVTPIDESAETVTPTGAALLTTWKNRETPPDGCWSRIGHGLGARALRERPNLLRAFLYPDAPRADSAADECLVLECNLDDVTPELVGALTAQLLERGAWDVFTIPVYMKKQRPGVLLTVLANPAYRDTLLDLIFRESTTLGIRERRERRTVLARHTETVQTDWGPIRIKIGLWQGDRVTASPEFSDCVAAAHKAGVPVKRVYDQAAAACRGATGR